MTQRRVLLGLCVVLAGCSFDDRIKGLAQLSCQRDTDCPTSFVCDPTLGRCSNASAGFFTDVLIQPRTARRGTTLRTTLTLSPAAQPPQLSLLDTHQKVLGTFTLEPASSDRLDYRLPVGADWSEGPVTVVADALLVDGGVLLGTTLGQVQLDFTPPAVKRVSATLSPAADNPLVALGLSALITRAGPGARYELEFEADEPLSLPPTAVSSSGDADGGIPYQVAPSSTGWRFRYDVPSGSLLTQGPRRTWVALEDLAGNQALLELSPAPALDVDTVEPAPPNVDQPGAIIFTRAPWGTDEEPAAHFTIRAAEASMEGTSVLQVFADGFTIGAFASNEAGRIDARPLNLLSDRLRVEVRVIDAAGNTSGVRGVRTVEWLASSQRGGPVHAAPRERDIPCRYWADDRFDAGTTNVSGGYRVDLEQTALATAPGSDHLVWFDTAEQQLYRFSAAPTSPYSSGYGDVGVWNGRGWTNVGPLPSTATQRFSSVTYDERRGTVVGEVAQVGFGDTRALREAEVLSRGQATVRSRQRRTCSPQLESNLSTLGSASYNASFGAIAWDSARGVTSVISYAYGAMNHQTYDGTRVGVPRVSSPVMVGDVAPPVAVTDFSLAYDVARQQLVLFGGRLVANNTLTNTVWVFQQRQWRNVTPSGSPSPRTGAALVWDPDREVLVLYGGHDGARILSETWEWDGTNWQRGADGPPRNRPGMGFDRVRHELVLAGGLAPNPDGGFFSDSADNEQAWVRRNGMWNPTAAPDASVPVFAPPSLNYPGYGPSAVLSGSLAPHPDSSVALFVGDALWTDAPGCDNCVADIPFDGADLFTFVPDQGYVLEVPAPDDGGLSRRSRAAVAWDARRRGVVLFGGMNGNGLLSDTWLNRDGGWSVVTTPQSPPPLAFTAMTLDERSGVVMLHGGVRTDGGAANETWELDDTGWTLSSSAGPAIAKPSMCYESSTGATLVAGAGQPLWRFLDGGWSSEGPLLTAPQWLVHDPARGATLIGDLNSLYVADDAGVHLQSNSGRYLPAYGAVWEPEHHRGVVYQNTDRLFITHEVHPSVVLETDLSASGLAAGVEVRGLWVTARGGASAPFPDGGVRTGLQLRAWREGSWWNKSATNEGTLEAPALAELALNTPSEAARVLPSWETTFSARVEPRADDGVVLLNGAEVLVRLHFPLDGGR